MTEFAAAAASGIVGAFVRGEIMRDLAGPNRGWISRDDGISLLRAFRGKSARESVDGTPISLESTGGCE